MGALLRSLDAVIARRARTDAERRVLISITRKQIAKAVRVDSIPQCSV